MRVIRFRAKEFLSGNWIFASAYDQDNGNFIIGHANFAIIDETVGEFTGFKDIDGNEIYEGDIIQNDAHPEIIEVVEMIGGCWSSVNLEREADDLAWSLSMAPYKVIGNVHDNPELLGSAK